MINEPRFDDATGVNPYATRQATTATSSGPATLDVAAWIAIACCVTSVGFWLLALVASLPYGSPNAPPLFEILGFIGMFIVLPAVGIAGAVSMLQRKRYGLSLAAAFGMMVPLLGPCFGLTLPIGIWAMILLRRPAVRVTFSGAVEGSPGDYDDPDQALAAASRLDRGGDWDAAIALYRSAASRWPEHAVYAESCISEVMRKQAAAL